MVLGAETEDEDDDDKTALLAWWLYLISTGLFMVQRQKEEIEVR